MIKKCLIIVLTTGMLFTNGCTTNEKVEVTSNKPIVAVKEIVSDEKLKLEAQAKEVVLKKEAEEKAKKEADEKVRLEAEKKVKLEAEAKAKGKEVAEAKAKEVAKSEPSKQAPVTTTAPKNSTVSTTKPTPKPAPEPTKQVPTKTPSSTRPTLPSKYPLEYQAGVENEVVRLCNIERAKVGAKPLVMNEILRNVARYKSNDMLQYNYFAHTSSSNGLEPHELVNSFGYKWTTTGENIWAYKMEIDPSDSYFFEIYKKNTTASEIVTDWMNSPGHRANILKGAYGRIGVGIVYSTVGKTYATQEFSN